MIDPGKLARLLSMIRSPFIRSSAKLMLAIAACACLSSCSLSFGPKWQQALQKGPQTGVEGAWRGTWKSEASGHHGALRCIVGPVKNTQGEHDFTYHAVWMGVLSGSYVAPHQVKPTKDHSRFSGQHKMPDWAGGLYTYDGTVKGDTFHATYRSAKDHGSYELKRVR